MAPNVWMSLLLPLAGSINFAIAGLDVHGQSINGPKTYGVASDGFVGIEKGGTLTQKCNLNPPYDCGTISGGLMSGLYISDEAQLIQEPESSLTCGNYTVISLEKACILSMQHQAVISPNPDFGGGRIEIICRGATWSLGSACYINLDRQAKIIVNADFTMGKDVMIRMEPATTLDIGNSLEMQDIVWLTMFKSSTFQINPTSGGAAVISSSNDFTITQVILNPSATLLVNGTFNVGNGRQVTMTVGTSGSLIITDVGQFEVQSTTFEIGPSSFWLIDGMFTLDKTSTFSSGMQSNLTIHGTMKTTAGDLHVAPFSSFVIKGTCTNKGSITTNEYSRLVIGPTSGNQGTMLAESGAVLYMAEWSTVQIYGYFQSEKSQLNVGARGTVLLTQHASVQQETSSIISLGPGAALNVTGQYGSVTGQMILDTQASVDIKSAMVQKAKSLVQLGEEASATFIGSLTMSESTSLLLGEGAELSFADNVEFQDGSMMQIGRGSFMTVLGQVELIGGNFTSDQLTNVTLDGGINLFKGAELYVGEYSSFYVPTSTSIEMNPYTKMHIGHRASVTFCPKVFCILTSAFVVGDYKMMEVCTNTAEFQCYPSA